MNREEAITILKEVTAERIINFNWVSLANEKERYELHIKPENGNIASLKLFVEKHNLALKEVNGVLIIYREP